MAAKSWENDFRYSAICESMKKLTNENVEEPFDYPGSFCIPLAEKPIVGWTPGKIVLLAIVLGFAFLGSAVIITGKAERDEKLGKGKNAVALPIGLCLGIAGMGCFFLPPLADRSIMRILIGSRATDLRHRPGTLFCAEISNTDRSKMTISVDGDDYALILADHENRRLLIEGVAARYMIRAQDINSVEPFEFMNYVGAKIDYRISDNVSLSLAIARVSFLVELIHQLPILFFLRKLVRNRVFQTCSEALHSPNAKPLFVDDPLGT